MFFLSFFKKVLEILAKKKRKIVEGRQNFNNASFYVKQKEFFHGLGASLKDQTSQENKETRIRDERVKRMNCHRGKNKEHSMESYCSWN